MTNGLVHITSPAGHRPEYQTLFAGLLDLAPSTGPITRCRLRELITADRLLFATLDDDIRGFAFVALTRALLRRRTAGIFLRPQSCLGVGAKPFMKRLLFGALKLWRRITVISIMPQDFAPAQQAVTDGWMHDPQLWDRIDLPVAPDAAALAHIADLAEGRRVLVFLGRGSRIKGLPQLAALVTVRPALMQSLAIVVAGQIDADCTADAAQLAGLGAEIWDRRVTEAEMAACYAAADLVWACYDPSYDQASGIFGRAVQLGRPAVIRDGAMIGRYAAALGHPLVALPPAPAEAAACLASAALHDRARPDITPLVAEWRAAALEVLTHAL